MTVLFVLQEPYASRSLGDKSMMCASGILRLMSLDDALAPIALQIAVSWIDGPLTKRITAGEAFIAELGCRYPAEAAKRVWQLIAGDDLLKDIAFTAPAALLQNLIELDGDATPLLEMLCDQTDRLRKPRVTMEFTNLIYSTVEYLLHSAERPSGQLLNFKLLLARPETGPQLAKLWATLLRNNQYRANALGAIWEGLRAVQDREVLSDAFVGALVTALSAAEEIRFVADFKLIDLRRGRRDRKHVISLAHLIVDAMKRIRDANSQENK